MPTTFTDCSAMNPSCKQMHKRNSARVCPGCVIFNIFINDLDGKKSMLIKFPENVKLRKTGCRRTGLEFKITLTNWINCLKNRAIFNKNKF